MADENTPAFPAQSFYGLTKREYFAGQALAGLMYRREITSLGSLQDISSEAYTIADAMIEAGNYARGNDE